MWRIGRGGLHNFDVDEFAFAADRDTDPVHLIFVLACRQQVKAPGIKFFSGQPLGDVAHWNHAATANNDSFEFGSLMGKTKDAAGSDQLGYLRSRNSEAAFSDAQQHKGLRGRPGKILYRHFRDETDWRCDPLGS